MENTSYGKIALSKFAPVADGFRIYEACWLGNKPSEWGVMAVTGMEFRAAKSGPNKGKFTVPVAGTKRTVYVTRAEMRATLTEPELRIEQTEPIARMYEDNEDYHLTNSKSYSELFESIPLYTHPATIPEGWQLVPIEPTEEMLVAGYETERFPEDRTPREIYNAMLAAAPKPGSTK